MKDFKEYIEDEFILWNGTLGIRDLVSIGKVQTNSEITEVWLDEPYEFVGPLNLQQLVDHGEISFAQCVVMVQETWYKKKAIFQEAGYRKQRKIQKELEEDINRYNKKRTQLFQVEQQCSKKEYRKLLSLPLKGVLKSDEIKRAFRIIAKKSHPDVGGSNELFVKITKARDILLESV